jgi:Zn-dependent peptidase ImmA (M78 family)
MATTRRRIVATTAKIKAEARKLLARPGADLRPLPVERLVRSLDLELAMLPQSDDDLSGFFFREGERRVIGVNSTHPPVRQRFTIAHELGHYILHDSEGLHLDEAFKFRDRVSSLAIDPQEIDANRFAAELLMPEDEVLAMVGNGNLDFNDDEAVRRVARHFGVSQQALTIRLTALRLVVGGAANI